MFGKRGTAEALQSKTEITSVDKAVRVLSDDERAVALVNRYQELQIDLTTADAPLLSEAARELRDIFKNKGINLGLDETNDADIRVFAEAFDQNS